MQYKNKIFDSGRTSVVLIFGMTALKSLKLRALLNWVCQVIITILVCLVYAKPISTEGNTYDQGYNNVTGSLPCHSPIYCIGGPGTLLHTVQMSNIYKDSKEFVDKPMKHDENTTLNSFRTLMKVFLFDTTLIVGKRPSYISYFKKEWQSDTFYIHKFRSIKISHRGGNYDRLLIRTLMRKDLSLGNGFHLTGNQMLPFLEK